MTKHPSDSGKKIVLCVDDNASVLKMLGALLKARGYAVLAASSATAALAMGKSRHFDLAILDYDLPEMTGTSLATKIGKLRPGIRTLLYSGHPTIPAGDLEAVDGFVGKGASIDELVKIIQHLLSLNGDTAPA